MSNVDAERARQRRIAIAQIRQYPDAALKIQARPVDLFDAELLNLVTHMKTLMGNAGGIGLAANQVGVVRRLFIFHPGEGVEAAAVINPEIIERSQETEIGEEGCLSIQGFLVPVKRAVRVTLIGQDENGADVRYDLAGLYARAAQHEIDHLDGIMTLDRTGPELRRALLRRVYKIAA